MKLLRRDHTRSNGKVDDPGASLWAAVRKMRALAHTLRTELRELDHRVSLLERRLRADATAASRARTRDTKSGPYDNYFQMIYGAAPVEPPEESDEGVLP